MIFPIFPIKQCNSEANNGVNKYDTKIENEI